MNDNKDLDKEFRDALDSKDPDRIGSMLSEMSDSEFEAAGKEFWDSEPEQVDDSTIDTAFRSFRSRTGCLHSLSSYPLRLCAAAVAAVVIAVAGFWAGTAYSGKHTVTNIQTIAWTECSTDFGQMTSVVLPDSSVLWLNSGSRLLYPEKFIGDKREIFLSGEMYIEVSKDSLHPFIVKAGGAEIRVTGTRFNVKAYPEDGTLTTTLMEGGVDVKLPGRDIPVTLSPGRALAYDRLKHDYDLYDVNLGSYPSWYNGEFNAYHMTLAQIARDLERRFGVKIIIRNQDIADEVFYASFVNGEDVDRILEALNFDGNFKIRRDGNFIDIY